MSTCITQYKFKQKAPFRIYIYICHWMKAYLSIKSGFSSDYVICELRGWSFSQCKFHHDSIQCHHESQAFLILRNFHHLFSSLNEWKLKLFLQESDSIARSLIVCVCILLFNKKLKRLLRRRWVDGTSIT